VATTCPAPDRDDDDDEDTNLAAGFFNPARDATHETLDRDWLVPRHAFLATASDATEALEATLGANSRLTTAPTAETLLAIADAIVEDFRLGLRTQRVKTQQKTRSSAA
jgi:hypothetical protein